MTLEEQYTCILEKQQDAKLIPFLQALTPQERAKLSPHIKKLGKDYLTFKQQGNGWTTRATDKQRNILMYSFFACYNLQGIRKENPAWLLSREHLEKFLSWYCPAWLSDYINSFSDQNWLPYQLDYGYLIELTQRGFVQPVPQLIARMLVPFLYEHKGRESFYDPERLLQHPVTLQEHIWHLFQYETTIHFSNRYLYQAGKQVQKGWLDFFLAYSGNGTIDRLRLLRETLMAAHQFNKNLSGWFAELFTQLTPTEEEILLLQPELFNLFASPHGKVISIALQACKQVAGSDRFDATGFLDQAALLLPSPAKSVVAATLHMLEKLTKKDGGLRSRICLLATGALIHKEESLQTRAARLIRKGGNPQDEELKATIRLYGSSLFSAARSLLEAFLSREEEVQPVPDRQRAKGALTAATALPVISNMDELVFLSAQAFDNNQSWHIDLLPATLIRLQKEIRGEHIPALEPAMQRALRFYFDDWRSNQGQLDHLLACFFLDYCLWLIRQYPQEGSTARELFSNYFSKQEYNKKLWEDKGTYITFFEGWKAEDTRYLYSAYRNLLEGVLTNLKQGIDLPLLCTPTHEPAWIDPAVLVERLLLYQQQGAVPHDTDLQIALSRCWLHGTEKAIRLAHNQLEGESKRIMLFLLDKEQQPTGPFTMEAAWMTAALSKSPQTSFAELADLSYGQQPRARYTGQYPYQILRESYTYTKYNWINGKNHTETATAQRAVVRLDLSAQQVKKNQVASGLKKFFSLLAGRKEDSMPEPPPLLYDYLRSKEKWLSSENRDIRRLLLLTPNHPEPLLAFAVEKGLCDPAFFGETAKRLVIRVLEVLHETGHGSGEMGHLMIALCLVSPDKTIVSYAAEIWLQGVEEKNIDSRLLGSILGRLESIEFAPFKRLTDLLVQHLTGISPLHNHALEILLTSLLQELPEGPLRGLKKLLEIYCEVLRLNASTVKDEALKTKLQQWKQHSTLGKVLKEAV